MVFTPLLDRRIHEEIAVMHAARQGGASRAEVLRYADSSDVSGDKSSVVGYMAAAMW